MQLSDVVLGRDWSRTKKSVLVLVLHAVVLVVVLVLQVWCCVAKHYLVMVSASDSLRPWSCINLFTYLLTYLLMLVVIMILKDTATFQVLFIVSLFLAWNITVWRSTVAFTHLKVKSGKCLCLLPVFLI